MNEIETLETIIAKLNHRLSVQEKEVVHLKTIVKTNETNDEVEIHKMIIIIISNLFNSYFYYYTSQLNRLASKMPA